MITVKLDSSTLIKELGDKADAVLQRAVDVLGEFALDRLRQLSSSKLKIETWQEFSKALTTSREKDAIILSISDPRMESIETGYASFDIKSGLLSGPKVKQGESGPYQDVPFQHKTTARGKGTYIEPLTMRKAVNKAMQVARSTGKPQKVRRVGGAAPMFSGMKASKEHGAQTFRRVSVNSSPMSWIHPGLEGIHVFEKVAEEVEAMKDRVLEDLAKAAK